MSTDPQAARYDLLAYNLSVAIIAALLMATVGSSLRVVQLLELTEIAGLKIDLAFGIAVNLGVVAAAAAIAFAMAAALCCVWHNRLGRASVIATALSVAAWTFTSVATICFILTLATIPLTLAIEVGL